MNNLSVMLVEDNADDEYLAIIALDKAGLKNITVARDGLEAINMLHGDQKSGGKAKCRPDLIFLDLRIPKLDGVDVLRKIRSNDKTKFLPVVILTSAENLHSKQICHDLAVVKYFSKPLQVKDIVSLGL